MIPGDAEKNVAVAIAAAVRSGEISAREICDAYEARIHKYNPSLNAIVTLTLDVARAKAAAVDRQLAMGQDPGPLAGVPCAVKDNLCTRDVRTTCASRILEDWVPPYDATAVARLLAGGSALAGKTNLDEFGMGSSTEHSIFGPTRNPYDTERVAGGSSGGSAAAVAAGLVPIALGSDTGGSVRQPASLCGVVGVKPTYGRVSRYGLVAYGSSFDQVGCLARSVADAALAFDLIAGHDPCDNTSILAAGEPSNMTYATGLRVGLVRELLGEGVSSVVAQAVEDAAGALADTGAVVNEVSVPALNHGLSAYYQIASAEASSNLARFDGTRYGLRIPGKSAGEMTALSRSAGFGDEVKRRIMLGTYVLSAGYSDEYYERARRVRTLVRRDFALAYERCDILLAPTYPTTAFGLGEKITDPVTMYAGDVSTVSSNLAGDPAMSVPFGADERGLPIGVQIMAPALREDVMFQAALRLEEAAPKLSPPPG
jgi:aspartyl-tRNA(Asn)/glutamyl-tRNA(Gln) amidotransferase subunit A